MVAPLIVAGLIGGAASLISGFMGASAADKAAKAQQESADKSLALQEKIYNQNRADAMPWLDAGRTALDAYMGELGISDAARSGTFQSGFRETPGYQFAVDEAEKGVVNNLAALGMKQSGAALKALTKTRMGLADQTYQQYLDRLSGASVGGQTQASNNASLGQNYAQSAGQTMQDAGAARASGYVGGANAWQTALGNFSNNLGTALGGYDQNWQKVA